MDSSNFTTLYIVYWTYYDVGNPSPNFHHAQVLGSIDGGTTWPYEIKWYGYNDFMGSEYINITSWAVGKNQLRFKWKLRCSETENLITWMIDSVKVYGDKIKKDIDHNVEKGKEGWRPYPDGAIEPSSIGIIKVIYKD
ncbi:MAG: hypothetical protein ACUVWP_02535 [bacterium]